MGGVIFVFLLALLVAILVLPGIRAYFDARRAMRQKLDHEAEKPHEAVIRRLDDHRARRKTPTDAGPDV